MAYKSFDDSVFWAALQQRSDLASYGNLNAALYALEIKSQIEDIDSITPTIITEGGDDENIDLLFVDQENCKILAVDCRGNEEAATEY